jgi:SAM-dependent methyltransferase
LIARADRLHQDRSRAESFGSVAELYDRARPSYPPALLDAVTAGGARQVLDVGCGTGIAAALLIARGCDVTGVEVDPRMAEIARRKGLHVEVGAFEDWEDRGRRFDLVTSGQAWHWINPGAGAAKAADVLRPGARIAAFWNFGDPPPQVRRRLAPIYDRLAPELTNSSVVLDGTRAKERLAAAAAGIEASGRFAATEVRRFPWTLAYGSSDWADHVATHSDHQGLGRERRDELLVAVRRAIDDAGGRFAMAYETVLVTAVRA